MMAGPWDDDAPVQAAPWENDAPTQRVVAHETENPEVIRLRALGYSDSEIADWLAPVDAMPEVGSERALVGTGEWARERKLGAQQFLRKLTGEDTSDIDAELLEMQRLSESGGLAGDPSAMVGRFAPYAPLMMNPSSSAAWIYGLGAAEAVGEAVTTPVMPTEDSYWMEKMKQLGVEAGLTLGLPGGIEATSRLKHGVANMGEGATDRLLGGRVNDVVRREGDEFADRVEVSMSPGQRYGGTVRPMLEEWAAGGVMGGRQVDEIREIQAGEFETFLGKFWDEAGLDRLPRLDAARKVQGVVKAKAKELIGGRAKQADLDYAEIRGWQNGRPMVDGTAYKNTLERIIEEGNAAGATADQVKAAGQAEAKLRRLDDQYGYLSGRDIEQLTRTSDSGGSVFALKNQTYDDVLAGRLRDAVYQDVAEFGDEGLNALIDNARNNYKGYSDAIDMIEQTALGKVVGDDLASAMLKSSRNKVPAGDVLKKMWAEGDVDTFVENLRILDDMDPEVGMQLRLAYLDQALDASRIRSASGGEHGDIDYVGFLQALGVKGSSENRLNNVEKMRALFANTALAPMSEDLIKLATIMADSRFKNFSNTDIRRELSEFAEAAAEGTIGAVTLGATAGAGGFFGPFKRAGRLAGRAATQKAVLDRADPRSANFLNRGPRPELTIPRRLQTLPAPPIMAIENEGNY